MGPHHLHRSKHLQAEAARQQHLSEGQRFKLAFLVGLFLTNLLRCVILLYDGLSHSVYEEEE